MLNILIVINDKTTHTKLINKNFFDIVLLLAIALKRTLFNAIANIAIGLEKEPARLYMPTSLEDRKKAINNLSK